MKKLITLSFSDPRIEESPRVKEWKEDTEDLLSYAYGEALKDSYKLLARTGRFMSDSDMRDSVSRHAKEYQDENTSN